MADPQRTVRELLDRGIIEACFQKPRAEGLMAAIRTSESSVSV